MTNEVIETILARRSVRSFTDQPVDDEQVRQVLEAGRWAPSGRNNQPWRFVLVRDAEKKGAVAAQTKYSRVIERAPVCVALFLEEAACYDPIKDAQSAGACLQNMLLAAHSLGLGAVWLGEILKNADRVRQALELPPGFLLQAVVALGHPSHRDQRSVRHDLDEFIVRRF